MIVSLYLFHTSITAPARIAKDAGKPAAKKINFPILDIMIFLRTVVIVVTLRVLL